MPPEARAARRRESLAALLAATLACFVYGYSIGPTPAPAHDTLRYLDYAIGLHDAGVFGLRDTRGAYTPGRANAPLYPLLVAALMDLDPAFADSARCHVAGRTSCPVHFEILLHGHLILAALGLWFVFAAARRLLGAGPWPWLAAALVLLSAEPIEYAHKALTENLVIALTAALFFAIVRTLDTGRGAAWIGVVLGLLALTRPEYAYLGVVLVAASALAALRWRGAWVRGAALIGCGLALAVTPWMARNAHHFGAWSITGGYAGPTLYQRLAYDRMPWPEVGVAFLYWFPDIGDSLGRRIAGADVAARLDWGPQGYYHQATREYATRVQHEPHPDREIIRQFIDAHLRSAPGKYLAVSLALAWRGLFVAKLWGVLGVAATLWVFIRAGPALRLRFVLAAAPFMLMVAFYAAVSVSIPRYNLGLLPVYAIAMSAWLAQRWNSRRPSRA